MKASDEKVFLLKLHVMTDIFNYQMPKAQIAKYWEFMSEKMDMDKFLFAANSLIETWTFPGKFPLPGNFVEAAKAYKKIHADDIESARQEIASKLGVATSDLPEDLRDMPENQRSLAGLAPVASVDSFFKRLKAQFGRI